MSREPSLAIVVASCDKYSDLWGPLFAQFFKCWPDCPYPIYLVANNLVFPDSRVTTLTAGDDVDWSTTIFSAISKLEHTHLLFWIDDAFLDKPVPSERVATLFADFQAREASFLRLRPNPRPSQWATPDIGILSSNAEYRVSLFASIWDMDILKLILRPGESAWQFELAGTERSRELPGFYCTSKEIFSYLHGVERGIWIRSTAFRLQSLGHSIDFNRRSVMSRQAHAGLVIRRFKSWVFHVIPERYRPAALRNVRRFYAILGLR